MNQKGFANIVLVIIGVVIVSAIGYFVFTKTQEPVIQQTTTPPPTTIQATTPQTNTQTTSRSSDFETFLNKKDVNGVLNSLASDVSLSVEATSCCGLTGDPWSPVQVRDYLLNYVKNNHTFNFSQDQAFVVQIKKERPEFQNYIIGIGDSESVVMYKVNAENKVNNLYLAATYKLLIADASLIDKTAYWKAYTHPSFGFTLKYPPDWTLTENHNSPEDKSFSIVGNGCGLSFNVSGGYDGVDTRSIQEKDLIMSNNIDNKSFSSGAWYASFSSGGTSGTNVETRIYDFPNKTIGFNLDFFIRLGLSQSTCKNTLSQMNKSIKLRSY